MARYSHMKNLLRNSGFLIFPKLTQRKLAYLSFQPLIFRYARKSRRPSIYLQLSAFSNNLRNATGYNANRDLYNFCKNLERDLKSADLSNSARTKIIGNLLLSTETSSISTLSEKNTNLTADMIANACATLANIPADHAHTKKAILIMSELVSSNKNMVFSSSQLNKIASLLRGKSIIGSIEVRHYIKVLSKELVNGRHRFTQTEILQFLSHLDCMNIDDPVVHEFLVQLITFFQNALEEKVPLNIVIEAVSALRDMSGNIPEIRKIVSILSQKMAHSNELIDGVGLTNCLMGMRRIGVWHNANILMRGIANHANKSAASVRMTPNQLALSIDGFCDVCIDLSNDSKQIISILTDVASRCTDPFSVKDLCTIVHSLRRSTAGPLEIKNLLLFVVQKLLWCYKHRSICDSVDIYRALNGLICMDVCPEVLDLIEALTNLMSHSDIENLLLSDISNGLYGLQRLNSDDRNMHRLLSLATSHLYELRLKNPQKEFYTCAANSLFGLRGMSSKSIGAVKIREFFLHHLKSDLLSKKQLHHSLCDRLRCLVHSIWLTVPSSDMSVDMKNNYLHIAETVFVELESQYRKNLQFSTYYNSALELVTRPQCKPKSFVEAEFFKMLNQFLLQISSKKQSQCVVECNVEILNFECDIVLNINCDGVTICVINIELDGPHHMSKNRILFAQLRDDFLFQKSAVVVVRFAAHKAVEIVKAYKDGRFSRQILSATAARSRGLYEKLISARPDLFPADFHPESLDVGGK